MSNSDAGPPGQSFHHLLFDSFPLPAFVVDPALKILECNPAAADLVGEHRKSILERPAGDVLNCAHASPATRECNEKEICSDCVVNGAVKAATLGQVVTRQWAGIEQVSEGKRIRTKLRVTTRPVSHEGRSLVLMLLEGMET